MKKLHAVRPSPAMVVAILALSLSVAGTAAAAGVFTKQETKGIKKVSRKAVKVVPRIGATVSVAAGTSKEATSSCAAGETLVGGGEGPQVPQIFGNAGNAGSIQFNGPAPTNPTTTWQVNVYSAAGGLLQVTAYCQRQ